jgi:hypothetical protein
MGPFFKPISKTKRIEHALGWRQNLELVTGIWVQMLPVLFWSIFGAT